MNEIINIYFLKAIMVCAVAFIIYSVTKSMSNIGVSQNDAIKHQGQEVVDKLQGANLIPFGLLESLAIISLIMLGIALFVLK